MKTVIFDIETLGLQSELYHADMNYLKQRGTNKTEEKVLEELSLNPYISNVIAAAKVELNEENLDFHTSKLNVKVWYLTESEDESYIDENKKYMQQNYNIEYIPIKLDEADEIAEITKKERDLLQEFFNSTKDADLIVSYNGKRFDSSFLFIRSIFHNLDLPDWILNKKTETLKHLDILEFLSRGYSEGKYSLDFISRHMGLKTSKLKHKGSKVRDLFLEGKYKEIALYCASDTIVVTHLYLKLKRYYQLSIRTVNPISDDQLSYIENLIKELINTNQISDEVLAVISNLSKEEASKLIDILIKLKKVQRNQKKFSKLC